MLVTRDEAEEFLEPYFPRLCNVFNKAFDTFKKESNRVLFNNRTKSSIINDLIVYFAQIEFAGTTEIRFRAKSGCIYMIIRDRYTLKFKKFNKKLRPGYIPTKKATQFVSQEQLFHHIMPMTNVFAGYKCDKTYNNISVFITCPINSKNHWVLELESAEHNNVIEITPHLLPQPAQSPTTITNPQRKRATAKEVSNNVEDDIIKT